LLLRRMLGRRPDGTGAARALVLLCLLVVLAAGGCFKKESTTGPITGDLTGEWSGTWTDDTGGAGALMGPIIHTGYTITGSLTFQGSACFTETVLVGRVMSNYVTAGSMSAGGDSLDYSGFVSPSMDSISGSYNGSGPCAGGSSGTFTLEKDV
jgi:hypothetical protein